METSLHLTYLNDTEAKLEAVVELPNKPEWVIANLKVTVGNKIFEAQVQDKKKAQERYQDAIARGH